MAEPSYYPLSPLKYPLKGATSPFEQPTKSDSPHHPADTVGPAESLASRSTMFVAPLGAQQLRKVSSAGHPTLWRAIEAPLTMVLLPVFAIAYLAFCYTVHGRVVPVNTHGFFAVTPEHLATIKGGITSISIIIISIALYPICDIVSKLKSEEFFRVLTSHTHGVPLKTINRISTPTFGNIDMAMAVWRHRCSNYYILGIIASLLVWVASTLAPGILTLQSVLTDSGLIALAIGAVPQQSVLNGTNSIAPTFNAGLISDTAAAIAWAEMELDVQYSFGFANVSDPDYAAFIAPVPLDLPTTTTARWLSDVIGLNPTCSWASTNITTPVQVATNSTSFNQYFATAYLSDFNLDVQVTADDLSISETAVAIVKDPTSSTLVNHSTQAVPSDGSTVFLLANCQSGCSGLIDISIDFTGVENTFTIVSTNQTWTLAILACIPNLTIETREVRNDGHGLLSVQPRPAGRQLVRQGNLNPLQTTALFSMATQQLKASGGKLTGNLGQYSSALGSEVQADLLFGLAQLNSLPASQGAFGTSATVNLAPIESISRGYTRIIQSAAKSYLAGYLGTAYVPGRISQPQLVFAAAIPNLAVSSAVFALLAALLVFTHFRSGKGVEFTLANVASAVHGSELPAQLAQMNGQTADPYGHLVADAEGDTASEVGLRSGIMAKGKVSRTAGDASDDHHDVAEVSGDSRVFMQRRVDGSPVLYLG